MNDEGLTSIAPLPANVRKYWEQIMFCNGCISHGNMPHDKDCPRKVKNER